MNKNYFIELADYNLWANKIVCNWLEQISELQWNQEVVSSFNSIQQTTLHIISAEKAWLERFQNKENIVWLQSSFKGTKEEHIALWLQTSGELNKYISEFAEDRLEEKLEFKRINGEVYTMPYYQLFAHVVNHAAYHRGQLVTMLRQTGFTNVQSTDLLSFYRN